MKHTILALLAATVVGFPTVLATHPAWAQAFNDEPLTENWWPSEFGRVDKAGAINRITPASVLEALRLVKRGQTATLGKYYDGDIPTFGARSWTMLIPGTPSGGPLGSNRVVYHDEYVSTELGQIGTQFDGPGHIGVRTSRGDLFYNGREREATYSRGPGTRPIGMGDLGVEHVAEKACAEQRRDARARFTAGEPGFGRSACEYLAERKIALLGGDTSSNEAQPVGEVAGEMVPCHPLMQTRHGIWNIENLDFEPLLKDGVYEFVFVWSPLKIVGATGSPGNPVAIW